MSKKILLLSSVIFLSSCATTNISELGDKFLDLINPSDAATEEAILGGEETLVAMDQTGGFTIDELEALSNDELIAIAQEKGLEDLILLDEDGNLLNRDQIINAIVESAALLESKSEELEMMSDDELIEVAVAKGRFAYIGPNASHCIGDETDVFDVEGRYLVPGLCDGHMHIESGMLTPAEFAAAVIPHGTTTMFTDPHEIANVLGLEGV